MEKYNLLVAGGGLTGVAAAISAARKGLRVLLVEKSGSLGGAMSNNLIFPFMPYWTQDPETNETKYLSRGFFEELRLRHMENVWKDHVKHFNSEYMKFLLDEMTDEANVDVLFHSCIFDVKKEGRKIESVTVASKSGKFELEADFYIDATGDYESLSVDYYNSFIELKSIIKQLDALNLDENKRLQEIDLLSYQVNEIESADLQIGEEEELTSERIILQNSEKLTESLTEAKIYAEGSNNNEGALSALDNLCLAVSNSAQLNPELTQLSEKLMDVYYNQFLLKHLLQLYLHYRLVW